VEAAVARRADTVLVDTAGRLHTQEGLMDELRKVARVVGRRAPGAPHESLLVLDGTVGQNAVQQGRLFAEAVQPTGLIITKLDGTARGGAAVALRRELDVVANNVANINKTKAAIKTAFQVQMQGLGLSLVEVLSTCPTNWHMTPAKALQWIEDAMIPVFPLGDYRIADAVVPLTKRTRGGQ